MRRGRRGRRRHADGNARDRTHGDGALDARRHQHGDRAGHSATPVTSGMAGAGLQGSITNVDIASDGQITVTFTLSDDQGVPLQPTSARATSDQQARVRFVIAHVEQYPGGGEFGNDFSRYVNDINATNPAFDSNGTIETVDAAAGVYRYVFNTMLPEGFDPTQTYTVGEQIDRTFNGVELGVDPIFDVVPAGGEPQILAGSATERCNMCHNPLRQHGNRREFRLCTLCHTEQAVDPKGTSIALKQMIHKIHRGKDLPSIVNGPPGAQYAIFSGFSMQYQVFAQKDENGDIVGVEFPRPVEECHVCHTGGATSQNHMEKPSAAACASCHDDVNPSLEDTAAGPPGTNHFQDRGYADGDCSFCHTPDGDEFDISVEGAHVVPEQSAQLQGLNVEIVNVSNTAAGQAPTISFKVTNDAGDALLDLSGLNRLGFAIAGPTTEYQRVMTATAVGGGASGTLQGPNGDGVFDYTPPMPIPADATGTWALGAEARREVELEVVNGDPKTVEEATMNPVVTFSLDASMPAVRRMVVDIMNCQVCHGEFSRGFSIHGNLRNQTQYCVLCHNPNATDAGRRRNDPDAVARGEMTAQIDFKRMIHRIHRGENLENKPYIIYGFSGPDDFSELRFPGDLRDCEKCHVEGTQLIPPFPGPAIGAIVAHLDPATGNEIVDGRLGPINTVCTACHDGDDAAAHVETMTSDQGVEACPVCHEEGRDFAVSKVHAD
jgi:OmcA/MtrC family decaheme c-type cytochrome